MAKICIEVIATADGPKAWAAIASSDDGEISRTCTDTKEQAEQLVDALLRNFKIMARSQSRVGAHFEANDA